MAIEGTTQKKPEEDNPTEDKPLTPYEKLERAMGFDIKEQSGKNLELLKQELGELSNDEQRLVDIFERMPFMLEHKTTNLASVVEEGAIKSYDRLKREGKLADNHTIQASDNQLGNTDFVFFHLVAKGQNAERITERKSAMSTLRFSADQLFRSGWLSLTDWHVFNSKGGKTSFFGDITREISFTQSPREITYKYTDRDGSSKSFTTKAEEEAFYNGDIIPSLARLLIRESRFIRGDFRANLLTAAKEGRIEEIMSAFQKLFRPEAKIPEKVELDQLI